MDKQQILSFIEAQLTQGKITRSDLENVGGSRDAGTGSTLVIKEETSSNLIHVFYTIGAIIALIGIGILVAQNWNEIGFAGRVLVSLGISLVTFVTALILRSPDQRGVSQVLFTLSAPLAPLGVYVLLEEASMDFTSGTQVITALALCLVYAIALMVSKKNILVLITIGFATWAYYAGIVKIFGFGFYNTDYYKWGTMLIGASFILIAYGFRSIWLTGDPRDVREKHMIQRVLYGFGTLAILGSGMWLGGIFDILNIVLIFAAFYASVFLRSRSMLTLAAFFLVGQIIKITSRYFVDSCDQYRVHDATDQ